MLEAKDKRITLTTDIVNGIKSIKYLSWEKIFKDKIDEIRKKEFKALATFRIIDSCLMLFWECLPSVLLCISLVAFIKAGNDLGSANVFTVYYLILSIKQFKAYNII